MSSYVSAALALLASLALLACSTDVQADKQSVLEVRVELYEADADAEVFPYRGEDVVLSGPTWFALDQVAPTTDDLGNPAVRFALKGGEKDRFREWTGERVGKRMALLADGKVVMLAALNGPLPGEGIMTGPSPGGFSSAEVQHIVDVLRPQDETTGEGSGSNLRDAFDALETESFEASFPLHLACKQNRDADVASLLGEGYDVDQRATPVRTTDLLAAAGHDRATERLSDMASKEPVSEGFTPLMVAARSGHADIARILIEKGATIDATVDADATALGMASSRGHAEVVAVLLEGGATVDLRLKDDRTALFWAAEAGAEDVVALLLDHGADIESEDMRGWTPLHAAASTGKIETVRLLLDRGASAEARTADGASAMDVAGREAHSEVVALLRSRGAD